MDSSHDRHTSLFLFEETAFPFVYLITFIIKQFKKEHEKNFLWLKMILVHSNGSILQ